ncbi:hypothetical protein YC2023_057999 [Brassica napus]
MANQPSVCIAFFAKRHIPPLTELRDNYGMYYNTGEVDEDGSMEAWKHGSMVFRGKRGLLTWFGKLQLAEYTQLTKKLRNYPKTRKTHVHCTSRVYKNFRLSYEPELVGEDCWDEFSEVYKLRSEILVMRERLPVEFEKDGQPLVRIAFFAKRHIPPLTEVRYDYGMSYDTGEVDEDGSMIFRGKRVCLCGSRNCHGSFEWNYEPELVGEDCWDEASEVYKLLSEILVSAKAIGNVSRLRTIAGRLTLCGSLLSLKRMANQPSVRIAWNYEPELVGEDCWDEVSEVYKLRSEILVSARAMGNISRFMNHSCSANVMWQPLEFEKDGQPSFGSFYIFCKEAYTSVDKVEVDEDGSLIVRGKRVCLCGSGKCHGFTFAIDESTPVEATPFSYLIPSFADNDNHQMENISSPTSQVVTPLQSPNRCMRSLTQQHLPFLKPHRFNLLMTKLQPANDENYNTPTPSHPGANLEKFFNREHHIMNTKKYCLWGHFYIFLH